MAKSRRCRGINWHDRPASLPPCHLSASQCHYIHPEEIPSGSHSNPKSSPLSSTPATRTSHHTTQANMGDTGNSTRVPLAQKRSGSNRSVSPPPRRSRKKSGRSPTRRHHLPPRPHSPPFLPSSHTRSGRGRSPVRLPSTYHGYRDYDRYRSRSPRDDSSYYYPSRGQSPHWSASRSRSRSPHRRRRTSYRSPSPPIRVPRPRRRTYYSRSRPSSPAADYQERRSSRPNPVSSTSDQPNSKQPEGCQVRTESVESSASSSTAYSEQDTNVPLLSSTSPKTASLCDKAYDDDQTSGSVLVIELPQSPSSQDMRTDHRDSVDSAATRYETKEEECEVQKDVGNELQLTLTEAIHPIYFNAPQTMLEVDEVDMELDSNCGQDLDVQMAEISPKATDERLPDHEQDQTPQNSADLYDSVYPTIPKIMVDLSPPETETDHNSLSLPPTLEENGGGDIGYPSTQDTDPTGPHVIPAPHAQASTPASVAYPSPSPAKSLRSLPSLSTLEHSTQQLSSQTTHDELKSASFEHFRRLFKPFNTVIRLRQEWDEAHKKVTHYQKALKDLEESKNAEETHFVMPMTPGPSSYGAPAASNRRSTRDPRLVPQDLQHTAAPTTDAATSEEHGLIQGRKMLEEKLATYRKRLTETQERIRKEMTFAEDCWRKTITALHVSCERVAQTSVADALRTTLPDPCPHESLEYKTLAVLQRDLDALTSRMNAYEDMERSGIATSQDDQKPEELFQSLSHKVTKLQETVKLELQGVSSTMAEQLNSKYDMLGRKLEAECSDIEAKVDAKLLSLEARVEKNRKEVRRPLQSPSGSPSKKRKRDGQEKEQKADIRKPPSQIDVQSYKHFEETVTTKLIKLEAGNAGLEERMNAQNHRLVEMTGQYSQSDQDWQATEKRLAAQEVLCQTLVSSQKAELGLLRKENKALRKELDATLVKSEIKYQERYNHLESQIDMMSKLCVQVRREMDMCREEQLASDKERNALLDRISVLERREMDQSAALTQCDASLSDIKTHLASLLGPWKGAMEKLDELSTKQRHPVSPSILSPRGEHRRSTSPTTGTASLSELVTNNTPPVTGDSPAFLNHIFNKLIELGTLINQHPELGA